jgi:hypothetical protein
MWPKTLDIYVHNEKYDSQVEEWLIANNLTFDTPIGQNLARIAYEVKLTYLVNEDGSYRITHVNDRKVEN